MNFFTSHMVARIFIYTDKKLIYCKLLLVFVKMLLSCDFCADLNRLYYARRFCFLNISTLFCINENRTISLCGKEWEELRLAKTPNIEPLMFYWEPTPWSILNERGYKKIVFRNRQKYFSKKKYVLNIRITKQ